MRAARPTELCSKCAAAVAVCRTTPSSTNPLQSGYSRSSTFQRQPYSPSLHPHADPRSLESRIGYEETKIFHLDLVSFRYFGNYFAILPDKSGYRDSWHGNIILVKLFPRPTSLLILGQTSDPLKNFPRLIAFGVKV